MHQQMALMFLQRAMEEALKAGGEKLLDELFSGLSEKHIDAIMGILRVVKERKASQGQKTG